MAYLSRFSPRSLFMFSVALAAAASLHAQQRPSFRSTIDLVMLNVTVTGPGGRYVADLSGDDFQVLEDGRPQELAYFSPANVPLSVSLVLDTSSSMDEEMALSRQAAMDFAARLRPGDVCVRRQVIVVLSDGEDTSSLVTFDHLLDAAKRSQKAIYTVGLGLEETAGLRATRSDGEFGLRQLAQETGGRLFLPKRPMDLVDVYTQIASELTSQYMVGYLSSNARADGAWRRIAVRVLRPNLQTRTRAGYYAATP